MALKCCSKRQTKLKQASFAKAKAAADAAANGTGPKPKARKAVNKKATAKKAPGCTVCAKKGS